MGKKRVCVLKGGQSAEREISLKSGQAVEEALKKTGYSVLSIDFKNQDSICSLSGEKVDLVFIALHGPGGEDGTIQGWLEAMGVPYTGSEVLASALAMDKSMCRKIWEVESLRQAGYQVITTPFFPLEISCPLVIKPCRSGSTLGVSLVEKKEQLDAALKEAFKYDHGCIIVEDYIKGREVTVGIVDDPEPRALPVIEIAPRGLLYDYHTKYTQGMCKYTVPASFPLQEYQKIQSVAVKAYKSLGCRDFGRVDMICKDGEVYVLEVNTIPGMTKMSLVPRAAKAEGMGFPQLVDKIVQKALTR